MKKILFLGFFIFTVFFINVYSSQLFKVFDFSPLSSEGILLKDKILVQPFIPLSDNLSVISFWLDNPTSSEINFKILDEDDKMLYQKRIIVPVLEGGFWGKEFQIFLGTNINLESDKTYNLLIEGINAARLKFFVKNTLELISGYENYLFLSESLKPLKINNQESNYFLKISFYEGQEFDPPIITNLEIRPVTSEKVEVYFNTNEQIIYNFEYKQINSPTTSFYIKEDFEICPEKLRKCFISLDVIPSTTYVFKLIASDFWNNSTVISGNFTTLKDFKSLSENNFSYSQNFDFYNLESYATFSSQINQPFKTPKLDDKDIESQFSSETILKNYENKLIKNQKLKGDNNRYINKKENFISEDLTTNQKGNQDFIKQERPNNEKIEKATKAISDSNKEHKNENRKKIFLIYFIVIIFIIGFLLYLILKFINKKYERFFNP